MLFLFKRINLLSLQNHRSYPLDGMICNKLACVAGGIGHRVRVLCLWRMAERGNRGAASELGRSRVEIKAGEARVRERRSRDPRAAQPHAPISSRLHSSLSLPFAINKARALGRQSR